MNIKQIAKDAVDTIIRAGFDKAQVQCQQTESHELYMRCGKINQLMTTANNSLALTGIVNNKKASMTINNLSDAAIAAAIEELMQIAQSSNPDKANDIADAQPANEFISGPEAPDHDAMYTTIDEFVEYVNANRPKVILGEGGTNFMLVKSFIANSNGVAFAIQKSCYNSAFMFGAQEGDKSTSFNYSYLETKNLNGKLIEKGTFETLLQQIPDQLNLQNLPDDFTGEIIITPDCLRDFLEYYTSHLTDLPLIKGTSMFKGKLNKQIADDSFTLHSKPLSEDLAANYFVTEDGYESQNSTIVEKGILKTYLLSQYGANKTGLEKAVNSGHCYIIEAGTETFPDMVKSIDKGLLLCRFSGGRPSANGDFSGVAKNSYYIENGKIAQPLGETMVSGNLANMFKNIKNISTETINFGSAILPWMHFDGVNVSGK